MIPKALINRIRSATKIEDVIGRYLHLSRSGQNLFAHCPFHEDKTPSFCVSPSRQMFKCFSCGRGGNVFQFLMDMKGLSFPQAVAEVARSQGINISGQYMSNRPRVHVSRSTRQMLVIYAEAARIYHHILVDTKAGEPALNYLHDPKKRALTDSTINTYNLGYAPRKTILKPILTNQGISPELMRKCGLFNESKSGQLIDRFYGRIIYPIRNRFGHPIAFSGRVLNKKTNPAKYLNSPETPLFHKGRVIFNLDLAKPTIRKSRTAILYEGFMDVIASTQAGVKNGLASMGTSLTADQARKLQHVTSNLAICYDGDAPGQRAINRALKLFAKVGSRIHLSVIQMPHGIDPDEYRRKYGDQKFRSYVKNAVESPIAFRLQFLKADKNLANERDQVTYLNQALQVIATARSPLSRNVYLNHLAKEFQINRNELSNQLHQITSSRPVRTNYRPNRNRNHFHGAPSSSSQRYPGRVELAERFLLKRMLTDRNVWLKVTSIANFNFCDEKYQRLFLLAQGYLDQHEHFDVHGFMQFIQENQLRELMASIHRCQLPKRVHGHEVNDYVSIIMGKVPLNRQIKAKQRAFDQAKKLGDFSQEVDLTKQIIKLRQKLQA